MNFYVEVANTNDIPVFSSEVRTIPLIDATPSTVIYDASASDIDGDALTYSIVNSLLKIDVSGEGADGTIDIALFNHIAPLHTARLGTLADDGAYDNVAFHRVIDGFMAQTGDVQYGAMDGNLIYAGQGGSTYEDLVAEFSDIPFDRGIVGMARSIDPDSANSQFFMMFEDIYSLNGNYTVVGEVVSGLDV
ncbi:peptidylprolyl isomerase, partial [Paracoccaceae bacterium]|nr:peptidylprolyl isomerase [Paracoccaceae bacterium]